MDSDVFESGQDSQRILTQLHDFFTSNKIRDYLQEHGSELILQEVREHRRQLIPESIRRRSNIFLTSIIDREWMFARWESSIRYFRIFKRMSPRNKAVVDEMAQYVSIVNQEEWGSHKNLLVALPSLDEKTQDIIWGNFVQKMKEHINGSATRLFRESFIEEYAGNAEDGLTEPNNDQQKAIRDFMMDAEIDEQHHYSVFQDSHQYEDIF